jgi:hypothetical protein
MAIERGWLKMHEPVAFVTFTPSGAASTWAGFLRRDVSLFAFSRHLFLTLSSSGTNGALEASEAGNGGKAWANHHAVTWEGV